MNKYKCGEKVTLNIWNNAFKCTIVALKHDIFLRKNRMGIMPIGALSIAFSSYLQGVDTFIESGKTHYGIGKKLKIDSDGEIREIILTEENYTNNITTLALHGKIPEVILFSPPNHRLMLVVDEVFDMIYNILESGYINSISDIDKYIPRFVMLSNGIYYDEVMMIFRKIFESLEEDIVEEIKGNFIRATTLQSGVRMKSGDEIVFKPGTKGSIIIAGGSKVSRDRVITLFKKFDYPVFEMEGVEVRRIEFDKATMSLSANGVQLSLILTDEGKIRSLTLGDLVSNKKMQELSKKIIYTMVSIGVKSGIYKKLDRSIQQEQFIDTISKETWKKLEVKCKIDNTHIISSIASVNERYERGMLENKLPPLEDNIINYVLNLAKENNLVEEKSVIEDLRNSIMQNIKKIAQMETIQ